MAFSAVIALAGGEAATATLVLTAVAEVGTAMTVVGAVTGNKDLMKIGAVMGLVGGVGGMIAGAGDAAAGAAGAAADTAGNAAQEGFRASEIGAEDAAGTAAENGVTGAATGADSVAQAGTAPAAPQPSFDTNPAQTAATSTPDSLAAQQATQPTQPVQSVDPNAISAPQGVQQVQAQGPADVATPYSNPTDMRLANGTQTSPASAPQSSGGFWNSMLDFANKNSKLLNTATTLAGGALKGANDQAMFQQQMQLKSDMWNRANSAGTFAPTTRGIVQGTSV
jgi:hypothetical protein